MDNRKVARELIKMAKKLIGANKNNAIRMVIDHFVSNL